MKNRLSIIGIFVFFQCTFLGFAQGIRHTYAEVETPIDVDFPFDNGLVDLNKLNPTNFLKSKISRDTEQVWDRGLQRWYNSYVIQNNFSEKCGSIKSRYDFKFDTLKRAVTVFSDTFFYENNRLKSIQNYEYLNGIKQIYESSQFIFKSNNQAPDTIIAVQGKIKKRISYEFSDLKPTLIKEDEIDSNQQVISQLQYKLSYSKGLLTSFLVEKWINNTWKTYRISNYTYNDLGTLRNQKVASVNDDFKDTLSYNYFYNNFNYLVQLDKDILGKNAQHLLTYKFTNFNVQGRITNVEIFAYKATPFIKVFYDNLIDDGKVRYTLIQARDENGNYVNSSRTLTSFCGDIGDGNGNGTTNVAETSNFNFSIFPNPAQDYIRIDAKSLEHSTFSVSIFDGLGRLVFQEYNRKMNDVIPTSNLTKGVYVLKLTDGKQVGVVKFVIQ
jgi:Secretion system C-terminal sorting domain